MPCHNDMMVYTVGPPEMFRVALNVMACDVACHFMKYYEPSLYRRSAWTRER